MFYTEHLLKFFSIKTKKLYNDVTNINTLLKTSGNTNIFFYVKIFTFVFNSCKIQKLCKSVFKKVFILNNYILRQS